jgi:hypothetical protein
VEYEINNEVITEVATKNSDLCCHTDGLIFIQPGINSLTNWSSISSKTIRIPNTWILLESQSTIDVFCN